MMNSEKGYAGPETVQAIHCQLLIDDCTYSRVPIWEIAFFTIEYRRFILLGFFNHGLFSIDFARPRCLERKTKLKGEIYVERKQQPGAQQNRRSSTHKERS
jgi:hypothetical protein